MTKRLLAAALLAGFAAPALAELVVLRDGDRVHGKLVVRGTVRLRLQTPYGLLIIPLDKIEKIVRDDGSEESLNAPDAAGAAVALAAPTPPPPAAVRLGLIITGKTFWQAWDPKSLPQDPSLRLEVRLDEKTVAAYVDNQIDEGEIAGAVVNSFSFTPEAVTAVPGPGARVLLPETRPGRILIEVELSVENAGERKLSLAYQSNDGTPGNPAWRDLATTALVVTLTQGTPLFVKVEQDPAGMEFRRKQMRNVQNFRIAARPE
ncbi:MAG TPA: hypothetical protein VI669_19315 [Vicinamibacteria bacterium]